MQRKSLTIIATAALALFTGFMTACNSGNNGDGKTDSVEMTDNGNCDAVTNATQTAADGQDQAAQLTFKDVAGIYDCMDKDGFTEYRIGLNEDGTATWNVLGSLHYTEFTYTITKEGGIVMHADGVDSEEEYYDYDPVKHTLSNEQGTIYTRVEI